jgi:(p)ppGpp synthase/HD superfamily hydrolase
MNIPLREKALAFATKYHHGQKRKDGKDYITHPIAVAEIAQDIYREVVKFYGLEVDEEFLDELYVASILHDVEEDTNATNRDIEWEFGYRMASVIGLLSKQDGQTYFDFIFRLVKQYDFLPIYVKLADLQHNTSDLNEGSLKDKYRFATYILRDVLNEGLSKIK